MSLEVVLVIHVATDVLRQHPGTRVEDPWGPCREARLREISRRSTADVAPTGALWTVRSSAPSVRVPVPRRTGPTAGPASE